MAAFVRLIRATEGAVRPAPGTRVLRQAEYLAWCETRELLEMAELAAQARRAEAEAEYERQRQKGYRDGMAQARQEMAARMLANAEQTVEYFSGLEHQVADLVMTALRKILGELDQTELMRRLVREALQTVSNQPFAILRVAPTQAASLKERLPELLAAHGALGRVEVQADARLAETDCILETDIGVVEASLEAQLEALDRAMRSRLQKRERAAAGSKDTAG